MIDGIRRRFGKSIDGDPWDAGRELTPEMVETVRFPTDATVLVAATHARGEYIPAGADAPDYYKSLVSAAIENGGKYGDHQMSIPWLRMILAGLDQRFIEPETMWYGVEAGGPGGPLPEIPSYEDLFPGNGETPTPRGAAWTRATVTR